MPSCSPAVTPTVSVVIPTHNRLTCLQRAVQSVLDQSAPVQEIIIVDDGSDDGTAQWLEQQEHPLIGIVQNNHGVSHARNRGIERAGSTWLALLDSDDYWHTDKLERQWQALRNDPESRFCHCDEIWLRNGKRINQKHKHRKYGGDIFEHCLPLCAISPSAALIHKDVFAQFGGFDESLPACEDYDLWLRITAQESVTYVDETLLVKTGGHDDQLSRRYPIMDRYRLHALAKLLLSDVLDKRQRAITQAVFRTKLTIVVEGAQKHGNQKLLEILARDYAPLVTAM